MPAHAVDAGHGDSVGHHHAGGILASARAAPVVDGGALVALAILGEFSWWVTIVILVRELGITAYRLVVVQREVVAASSGGKLKTILQSVLIGSLASPLEYFFAPWYVNVESALTALVLLITVYTGVQYLIAAGRARRQRINKK